MSFFHPGLTCETFHVPLRKTIVEFAVPWSWSFQREILSNQMDMLFITQAGKKHVQETTSFIRTSKHLSGHTTVRRVFFFFRAMSLCICCRCNVWYIYIYIFQILSRVYYIKWFQSVQLLTNGIENSLTISGGIFRINLTLIC